MLGRLIGHLTVRFLFKTSRLNGDNLNAFDRSLGFSSIEFYQDDRDQSLRNERNETNNRPSSKFCCPAYTYCLKRALCLEIFLVNQYFHKSFAPCLRRKQDANESTKVERTEKEPWNNIQRTSTVKKEVETGAKSHGTPELPTMLVYLSCRPVY